MKSEAKALTGFGIFLFVLFIILMVSAILTSGATNNYQRETNDYFFGGIIILIMSIYVLRRANKSRKKSPQLTTQYKEPQYNFPAVSWNALNSARTPRDKSTRKKKRPSPLKAKKKKDLSVPLDPMRYLRCPNCGKEDIDNKQNGKQSCKCGWKKE